MTRLGVVFTADRPPEQLPAFAAAAEAAGLDEVWMWEDCFFSGGIAASAAALAATERITVGIGVMPVPFRNPVAAAMEIATLARLHPGRFVAGLGHGVPGWMEQIGALPAKPMRALEETTASIRRLLAGERFSLAGEHVRLDDVCLEHPPEVPPPVVLGVRRPVGLKISGRSADGTILGEPSSPAYIRWARERIEQGRRDGGRSDPHQLTVFVQGRIDPDRSLVRAKAAEWVGGDDVTFQLVPLGRDAELERLRALGDEAAIAKALPDDLVDELVAAGTPEHAAASLRRLAGAGVDAIGFAPLGPDPDEQLRRFASEVVPALRAPA
jgi:alkanesulfonate monooxygenase SsuD/methylene tetrahydromethanopterin reductase-like flavin-dependent oxidoreductase (luciferase family)